MPYKISLPRFNEYIKTTCKEAELNTPTKWKEETQRQPTVQFLNMKQLVVIFVDVLATNFYGRIQHPY
jgi:hypothetical protein